MMNIAGMQCETAGRALVATLSGEIDFSNADGIRSSLTETLSNHSLALVLDLTAVDYLDSSGIELIYRLRQDLRARGQAMHLVVPDASAASTALRLAGVSQSVPTIGTRTEALAAAAAIDT